MTTFAGNPIHLQGQALKVGSTAPDFTLTDNDLNRKTLADFPGKKIISVVPSLDTGVCDFQTRKFNEKVGEIEGAQVLTVSVDLPFAQKRWCGAAGLEQAITLSDYYDGNFGRAYGVMIDEFHLLTRAVFVLDAQNKLVHVEYVSEVTEHPDYDRALEALRQL